MIPGLFEVPKKKSTPEDRASASKRLYDCARDIVEKLAIFEEVFDQDAVMDIAHSLLAADRAKNQASGMDAFQKQFGSIVGTNGQQYAAQGDVPQDLNPWVKKLLEEEDSEK